ncbi:hypothetical protein AALP_AA4G081400 [Arabis alpina]|uniref:Glycine-rich protein n=1 Tax=Arabis alpina TaxID=50452 RepID=A0A087H1X7_ARAAL|nr:hypothetical protein AALP_AA4G081400 [Arabis alpina]
MGKLVSKREFLGLMLVVFIIGVVECKRLEKETSGGRGLAEGEIRGGGAGGALRADPPGGTGGGFGGGIGGSGGNGGSIGGGEGGEGFEKETLGYYTGFGCTNCGDLGIGGVIDGGLRGSGHHEGSFGGGD